MLETYSKDNKLFTQLTNLQPWSDNPRKITETDFERLKQQIQTLGQYKPLLVTNDGVVIGGNMRMRAYIELQINEVWISVIEFKKQNDVIKAIAQKYGKTNAQVLIRWSLQVGAVPLPKSTHKERIEENINVFDFELSAEDMQAIESLNQNLRLSPNPELLA